MKKKIKKLVSSVLAFVIAFSALTIIPGNVLHAWYVSAAELVGGETGAEETYQSGSFTYTLVNEYTNVKLLSCSSDAEGLEIPDTIDGKYVTVLGGQTFQSNKTLKSVTLPKRLEIIEDAAFFGLYLSCVGGFPVIAEKYRKKRLFGSERAENRSLCGGLAVHRHLRL